MSYKVIFSEWSSGQCLALAKAVMLGLGGSAKLMDVVEPQDDLADKLMYPGLPHHVYVLFHGMGIDSDGIHSEDDILKAWKAHLKCATLRIEKHNAKRAKDVGLRATARQVADASWIADGLVSEAVSIVDELQKIHNSIK